MRTGFGLGGNGGRYSTGSSSMGSGSSSLGGGRGGGDAELSKSSRSNSGLEALPRPRPRPLPFFLPNRASMKSGSSLSSSFLTPLLPLPFPLLVLVVDTVGFLPPLSVPRTGSMAFFVSVADLESKLSQASGLAST